MKEFKRVFVVNGKPFFPIGGECSNSSGYDQSASETAFKAVKLVHGNTIEIPVYWDQVEPTEGKFDFTSVDALLTMARRYEVKLILLWFATWKNGNMDYAPTWVKTDPHRFKRVMSPIGSNLWGLSSFCKANLEADKKAFIALCKHLKAKDSNEHTLIGLQVENEPWIISGVLGCDRDYSPESQAVFDSHVPASLLVALKKAGKGRVHDIWQQAGGKNSGTWSELFGQEAGELASAWSIATFIDAIVEAGKAIFDIPMWINAWIVEEPHFRPGPWRVYPSGGPVSKVLDIYKWFTPHVDMIVPDIHITHFSGYESACINYARDDNPLFEGESAPGTQGMFRAIADYNSNGYFCGPLEHIIAEDGSVRPELQIMVDSVRSIAAAVPLLLKYQGTGNVHSIVQEEYMPEQWLEFNGYIGQVQFGDAWIRHAGKDWQHTYGQNLFIEHTTSPNRGRGLVIQANRDEFYLVGVNYRLFLRPNDKTGPLFFYNDFTTGRRLRVDEGHFDQNGEFQIDRRRNGDEIESGVWVEPDNGVVRVIMCD
jgi:Domain of unknown function (DUF5597)/Beta-galactosidase